MGGGHVWTVVAGVCGVDGEVYDLYLYGCPHRVARRHQVVGLVTFGYVCLPEGKLCIQRISQSTLGSNTRKPWIGSNS